MLGQYLLRPEDILISTMIMNLLKLLKYRKVLKCGLMGDDNFDLLLSINGEFEDLPKIKRMV